MHTFALVSSLLPLLSSTSAHLSGLKLTDELYQLRTRQVPTEPCATGVHVIGASGDGAENDGNYGRMATLVSNITSSIPGSNDVVLPYDKGSDQNIVKTEGGSQNLIEYLNQYNSACPDSKIVLTGYSAGAIITMNVLAGASPAPWTTPATALPCKWTKAITGIIIYGDETRAPPAEAPFDVVFDNYCQGHGRFPRTNTVNASPFFDGMQSYCNADDPQCCKETGFVPAAHFSYPEQFDVVAAKFIANRFKGTA